MSDTLFKWVKASELKEINWPICVKYDGGGAPFYATVCSMKELDALVSKYNPIESIEWLKPVSHISEDRQQIISECRDALLKQLFLMTHENDYPSEAVPKAIILSLPQLMKVSVTPVVENNNLLKAIQNEYADYKRIAELHMNENDTEIERLEKQLREQIAGAAISNDALLELNRKIAENTIDKIIKWCDEKIKEYDDTGKRSDISIESASYYFCKANATNDVKLYLQSLK